MYDLNMKCRACIMSFPFVRRFKIRIPIPARLL